MPIQSEGNIKSQQVADPQGHAMRFHSRQTTGATLCFQIQILVPVKGVEVQLLSSALVFVGLPEIRAHNVLEGLLKNGNKTGTSLS